MAREGSETGGRRDYTSARMDALYQMMGFTRTASRNISFSDCPHITKVEIQPIY